MNNSSLESHESRVLVADINLYNLITPVLLSYVNTKKKVIKLQTEQFNPLTHQHGEINLSSIGYFCLDFDNHNDIFDDMSNEVVCCLTNRAKWDDYFTIQTTPSNGIHVFFKASASVANDIENKIKQKFTSLSLYENPVFTVEIKTRILFGLGYNFIGGSKHIDQLKQVEYIQQFHHLLQDFSYPTKPDAQYADFDSVPDAEEEQVPDTEQQVPDADQQVPDMDLLYTTIADNDDAVLANSDADDYAAKQLNSMTYEFMKILNFANCMYSEPVYECEEDMLKFIDFLKDICAATSKQLLKQVGAQTRFTNSKTMATLMYRFLSCLPFENFSILSNGKCWNRFITILHFWHDVDNFYPLEDFTNRFFYIYLAIIQHNTVGQTNTHQMNVKEWNDFNKEQQQHYTVTSFKLIEHMISILLLGNVSKRKWLHDYNFFFKKNLYMTLSDANSCFVRLKANVNFRVVKNKHNGKLCMFHSSQNKWLQIDYLNEPFSVWFTNRFSSIPTFLTDSCLNTELTNLYMADFSNYNSYLPFENCILDLKTCCLRPYTMSDYVLYRIPYKLDLLNSVSSADYYQQHFAKFLSLSNHERYSKSFLAFMHSYFGIVDTQTFNKHGIASIVCLLIFIITSMSKKKCLRKLYVLCGVGKNGKSEFLNMIRLFLGPELFASLGDIIETKPTKPSGSLDVSQLAIIQWKNEMIKTRDASVAANLKSIISDLDYTSHFRSLHKNNEGDKKHYAQIIVTTNSIQTDFSDAALIDRMFYHYFPKRFSNTDSRLNYILDFLSQHCYNTEALEFCSGFSNLIMDVSFLLKDVSLQSSNCDLIENKYYLRYFLYITKDTNARPLSNNFAEKKSNLSEIEKFQQFYGKYIPEDELDMGAKKKLKQVTKVAHFFFSNTFHFEADKNFIFLLKHVGYKFDADNQLTTRLYERSIDTPAHLLISLEGLEVDECERYSNPIFNYSGAQVFQILNKFMVENNVTRQLHKRKLVVADDEPDEPDEPEDQVVISCGKKIKPNDQGDNDDSSSFDSNVLSAESQAESARGDDEDSFVDFE